MINILEELWYGNVAPSGGNRVVSDEARKRLKAVVDSYDELYATLSEEQKEMLEKFSDANAELDDVTEREIFVYAFRLGAQIALEILGAEL